MQKAKIFGSVILFVLQTIAQLALLALAGKPGNHWMVFAAIGVCLLFVVAVTVLIMSYLNRDLKEHRLRWRY